MNAVDLLIQDHEAIRELFDQFEEAGEQAHQQKQTIAEKVIEEITAHSQLEEEIFYPVVREKANKVTRKVILEGIEEHRVADFLIKRLKEIKPEDETFDAKFNVLIENVVHHFEDEEWELFPEATELLGAELDQLGFKMEALRLQFEV